MSIPINPGTIIAVSQLAWTVYKSYKAAPKDFQDISGEVARLHMVLKETSDILNTNETLGPEKTLQLQGLTLGCQEILTELEALLKRFIGLGSRSRLTFDRLRWAQDDISALRERVVSNVVLLTSFNSTVQLSSQARIEAKLDLLIAEYRAGRREGSVISTFTPDTEIDKGEVWQRLQRELEEVGFPVRVIQEKQQIIVKWLQRALASGLLEESEPNQTSGTSDSEGEQDDDHCSTYSGSYHPLPEDESPLPDRTTNRPLTPDHFLEDESFPKHGILGRTQPLDRTPNRPRRPRPLPEDESSPKDSRTGMELPPYRILGRPGRPRPPPKDESSPKDGRPSMALPSDRTLNLAHTLPLPPEDKSFPERGDERTPLQTRRKSSWIRRLLRKPPLQKVQRLVEVGHAVETERWVIAQYLLERDAGAIGKDDALMTAVMMGVQTEILQLMFDKGANPSAKTDDRPILFSVILNQGLQELRLFLDRGADPNAVDKAMNTALHVSCIAPQRSGCLRMLLEQGVDIEAKDKRGFTALHHAALLGRLASVQALLEYGANVNVVSDEGVPLHMAAHGQGSGVEVSQLLLTNGALIDAKTADGITPLHTAVRYRSLGVARLLLHHGANIEAATVSRRQRPLHMGRGKSNSKRNDIYLGWLNDWSGGKAQPGFFEDVWPAGGGQRPDLTRSTTTRRMVELLLQYGAKIEAQASGGTGPLSYAVLQGQKHVVEALLKHGANIEAQSKRGNRPLHYSVRRTHPVFGIVELLLTYGASTTARDCSGKTALDYSDLIDDKKIRDLLSHKRFGQLMRRMTKAMLLQPIPPFPTLRPRATIGATSLGSETTRTITPDK